MTTPKKSHVSEPALARKNMDIDVRKLAAARKFLGASSDTETVDLALDDIVFYGEVSGALHRLAALGGLDDIYAVPEKKPRRVRKS
jgi:Arc/MetJ family transcription regulator